MKAVRSSPAESLRLFFRLARIANLPTAWSNVLAAWLLGGGGSAADLAGLLAGASCLYVGGMFLNDAADAEWDRAHRPERPIPAGAVSRTAVGAAAGGLLLGGGGLVLAARWSAGPWAAGLLLAIVLYNWLHKRTAVAPLLMAACRGLLYCTAGSAAANGLTKPVLCGAAAMTVYIAGLSFLARRESTSGRAPRWPLLLVFAAGLPALAGIAGSIPWNRFVLPGAAFLVWSMVSMMPLLRRSPSGFGRSVSGLLAGIPLLDWLIAAAIPGPIGLVFTACFAAARALQKLAPAT